MTKETTVLNRIERIVDSIDYKEVYVEIKTDDKKYILEKDKKNKIGFETYRKIK